MSDTVLEGGLPKERASLSTYIPTNKVLAGGVAGALVTLTLWVLNSYVLEQPITLSNEVQAALMTVLTLVVQWVTPPGKTEAVKEEEGRMVSAVRG